MGTKLAGIMAVVTFIVCGLFYWYYNDTQERMAILNENNAKLETAVGEQQALVKQMKEDFEKIQKINKNLEEKNAKLKASEKTLADKLGRHDIGVLAQNKPGLVEKVINNASKNANRCAEIVSGAELTEDELNASKPSEINPECWQIANPNFDPHAQSDAWKEKNL